MANKLTLADVDDRLIIDKHQLDKELIAQPQLVNDVGMRWCDAMSSRDSFATELKETISSASGRIRAKLEKDSTGKITVAEVAAAVDSDPIVVEARAKEDELADRVRRWDVKMDSVKARGYALHKLCDLELVQGAAISGQSERVDRRDRREAADADTQRAVEERRKRRGG